MNSVAIGSQDTLSGSHFMTLELPPPSGMESQIVAAHSRVTILLTNLRHAFSPRRSRPMYSSQVRSFVWEMGELEGNDGAIGDQTRAETSTKAKEEHATTPIAARCLHGGIVEEADRFAWKSFRLRAANPSTRKVVGFDQGAVVWAQENTIDHSSIEQICQVHTTLF